MNRIFTLVGLGEKSKDSLVTVLMLMAVLGGMLLWTQMRVSTFSVRPGSLTWHQPETQNAYAKPPISRENWDLNFENIESALNTVYDTSDPTMAFSPEWVPVLDQVVEALPETVNSSQWQRMNMLFDRTWPGGAGNTLAYLVKHYHAYSIAEKEYQQQHADLPVNAMEAEQRFVSLLTLKERYLGQKTTQQLFSDQMYLADYLFARRKLQADKTLPEEQKQASLKALQETFFIKTPKLSKTPSSS